LLLPSATTPRGTGAGTHTATGTGSQQTTKLPPPPSKNKEKSTAVAAALKGAAARAVGSTLAASQDAAEVFRNASADDAALLDPAAGAAAGRGNTPADEVMQMYRRSTVNNI
jgi:hypothetical protein